MTLGTNSKTTASAIITGLLTLLLGVPTFITAITAWSQHQPVDWRAVGVSTALAVITAGLASAKDASTHSTPAQIQASGAAVTAVTPAQVAQAKVEVAQADAQAKKP